MNIFEGGKTMNFEEDAKIESLILKSRDGDESAFEELVGMYRPMIDGVIKRFSLDVDETFSEACMGFYRAVSSYTVGNQGVTFGLYAKICVERSVIDLIRKNERNISRRAILDVDVDAIPAPGGIHAMLEHREQAARFLEIVKRVLSDFEYDVYRYWMIGYKTADIARVLGVTAKSVDNAKNRMMRKLRDELDSKD